MDNAVTTLRLNRIEQNLKQCRKLMSDLLALSLVIKDDVINIQDESVTSSDIYDSLSFLKCDSSSIASIYSESQRLWENVEPWVSR